MINKIETELGYSYTGFRKGFHVFKNMPKGVDRVDYHYYEEDICIFCRNPRLKRRWSTSKSHKACNNQVMQEKRNIEIRLKHAR